MLNEWYLCIQMEVWKVDLRLNGLVNWLMWMVVLVQSLFSWWLMVQTLDKKHVVVVCCESLPSWWWAWYKQSLLGPNHSSYSCLLVPSSRALISLNLYWLVVLNQLWKILAEKYITLSNMSKTTNQLKVACPHWTAVLGNIRRLDVTDQGIQIPFLSTGTPFSMLKNMLLWQNGQLIWKND